MHRHATPARDWITVRPSRVWYLAYGSNINADRFRLYLEGGRTEPGARDATAPARSVFLRAPFRLTFAFESTRWDGGGVAFVTPEADLADDDWAWVRAWDITSEQFEDVFAQENRGHVGAELPWNGVLSSAATDIGDRWYRRILHLDVPELAELTADQPALTFTWANSAPTNPPNPTYRSTIAVGLAEHDGLDHHAIEAYLDRASLGA